MVSSEQIKHTLIDLYAYMREQNDVENSRKILELYEKYEKEEFIISFAGHFSAGKSSMINALLEMDVLPKSPIPTSANIVKLTSGGGYARMYFHEQEPVQYNEPYDMDLVRSYCKDKQSIHTIEINTSSQALPPHTAVFDTPGIDAADDADRLMTEGSLHIADVLFYVMDYNHVQSEVNLTFLHQLNEKKIPYYIIINQIDKHDEQEIEFSVFNDHIEHTFAQWDIQPEKLFYTSLTNNHAPHNMFPDVKEVIQELFTHEQQINRSIKRSIKEVVGHHKHFLSSEYENQTAAFESLEHNEKEADEYHLLQKERGKYETEQKTFYNELFKEVNQTVKNAQIMPFAMREHARLYLESIQPQFKVGLFGSRKKTEQEQSHRKELFNKELTSTIESAIQWSLRDKIKSLCESYDIPHTLVDPLLSNISVDNTEQIIEDCVSRGAQMSGEYVLNYTKDVHSEINTMFRKKVRDLWNDLKTYFTEHIQVIDEKIQTNQHTFSQAVTQQEELEAMRLKYDENVNEMNRMLDAPTYDLAVENDMHQQIEELFHSYTVLEAKDAIHLENDGASIPTEDIIEQPLSEKKHFEIDETIQAIEETIASIEDIPGFSTYIEDLLDKKDRLQNRTLTVALFGAFSAGKSSFANALLGDTVLPSSPNPTTAVITKIAPVDVENKHGKVVISLKDKEEILRDVKEMTKEQYPPDTSLEELLAWIVDEDIIHNESIDQMYRAYIHAMVDGYTYMKDNIGRTEIIDLQRFTTYATDETKACYIKEINVHYDCSITQKGITLVDTPGADSVNARHTNVSFEYIKEADAILYVTYYNHALSRADKDFLMQLGRVKESFELDKMFFIINAADLATDEQELRLVYDYVEEQLMLLGIRFPAVFPISSKEVLEKSEENESNMEQFNAFLHTFFSFLDTELPSLTMESAYVDMQRSLQALEGYIDYAQLDGAEKENRAQQLRTFEQDMYQVIEQRTTDAYEEQISNRIERQLFYVVERIGIRFHDFFKETFNPTTITEPGKKGQEQMFVSANALLRYSGYEFLQEIRAIALRVESEVKKQLFAHYEETKEALQQIEKSFLLPIIEEQSIDTPDFQEPFASLTYKVFQSDLKYHGTKAFFVQNEKDAIRERVYIALEPYIESYIEKMQEQMLTSYMNQWNRLSQKNDETYRKQIESYIEQQQQMLHEVVDIELLKAKRNILRSIV